MRINKYLAECGFASRRASEKLVTEGKVKLNGRVVKNLATDVTESDIVTVEGKAAILIEKHIYLLLNKPKGYICSSADEHDRKTVFDLLKDKYKGKRLFTVGRLDYDTEGLLLLTTDGDLCNRVTHPRNEITKTYVARVSGEVSESDLNKLRSGVVLDGVKTNKCKAKLLEVKDGASRIEVVISEGRNRQVRRMFESIGKVVEFLKRTAVGNIRLGGLNRGEYRELSAEEVDYLKKV